MKQKLYHLLLAVSFIAIFPLTADGKSAANHRNEAAFKKCSFIKKGMGIELLKRFHRKHGLYDIKKNSRKWITVTVTHVKVIMPALEHSEVSLVHKPFELTRYRNNHLHITIDIFTLQHNDRKFLQYTTTSKLLQKYGDKPLFTYLDEALGVYTHGYCDKGNPGKSIAMFLARAATVLPGRSEDSVYRLNHPRALLVVPQIQKHETINDATLMFPAKDANSITYEHIYAPASFIASLVQSLSIDSE